MKKIRIILLLIAVIVIAFANTNKVYGENGILSKGDQFIERGMNEIEKGNQNESKINEEKLKDSVSYLYNILMSVGIVIAVIAGMAIGIKYMVGSLEEKAQVKGLLFGYVLSCIVIFGAFGIWKIVTDVFSQI